MSQFARLLFVTCLYLTSGVVHADDAQWKAGAAKAVITPKEPMWMAGYGGRDHPAEGKVHDLYIRVLVLEDATGYRGVILSSDTLGFTRSIYDNTCQALKTQFGFERSQVMLHASHTHCGPVLRGGLYDIYPLDTDQLTLIENYSTELEQTIVETVAAAIKDLQPVTLSRAVGATDFAVNRRNNLEPEVPQLRRDTALKGPVDHSVPVLAAHTPDGHLKAVVFGYACHNTTLSFYRWCGDYAGFAQLGLEANHSGAIAMFYSGCGADQNPLPRRTQELCQDYGARLAKAVDDVLSQEMTPIDPALKTAYERIPLTYGASPTREQLQKQSESGSSYQRRWATRLLRQIDNGKPLAKQYDAYPVQAWLLGGGQLWIALGGEVVVDYALGFKKIYGAETWVAGYANDVMAYIPSLRVLEEDVPPRASSRWGYEGNTSMMVYGRPAYRWADDVEDRVTASVDRLVKELRPKP